MHNANTKMNTLFFHNQKGGNGKQKEYTLIDGNDLFNVCSDIAKDNFGDLYPVVTTLVSISNRIPGLVEPNLKYKSSYGDLHAFLRVEKLTLHNAYGMRKRVLPDETFQADSYRGLQGLYDQILLKFKAAEAKASSRFLHEVTVRPFRLSRLIKVNNHQVIQPLTEEDLIFDLAMSKKVYIEYLQSSYSTTTNTILDQFEWPFDLKNMNVDHVYDELQKHNTRSANEAARTFVEQRAIDLESPVESVRRNAEEWRAGVDGAVSSLKQWSTVLPVLSTYNEATRRLIINEVVLQVSVFTERSLMVEAYQCTNQCQPPEHFQGTGSVDYLVGLTTIEMYPTAAHTAAAETALSEEEYDYDDEDTDEEHYGHIYEPEAQSFSDGDQPLELQTRDILSAVHLPLFHGTVVEARQKIMQAALCQLMAQIHDQVYVTEGDLIHIANREAISNMDIESGKGPANKRKRELPEEPLRVHTQLTGIMTTGQTWQVYKFGFRNKDDPDSKMMVEFAGEFCMSVLPYGEEKGSSGASRPHAVDQDQVETIIAILVLSSTGQW